MSKLQFSARNVPEVVAPMAVIQKLAKFVGAKAKLSKLQDLL
jgi:hypothetical protein